jgi:hypothetical protein
MKTKLDNVFAILTRSELWAAVAVILAAIYQANVLPESWAKIAAVGLAVLTALGYGVARTVKKIEIAKIDAVSAAANTVNPTQTP